MTGTATMGATELPTPGGYRVPWVWAGFLAGSVLVTWLGEYWSWAVNFPRDWVVPLRYWISDFMEWLIKDLDFGLFTFKEMTRSIAWLLEWPLTFASRLLVTGFSFSDNPTAEAVLHPLPWIAVIAVFTVFGHWIRDWKLALLAGTCMTYLAVFGRWESAMVTLSAILIAVPLGVIGGLLIGIQAHRSVWFGRAIEPVLDLMQTTPVFAYLVPVLFLFGFGPVAAMIATMIYATPPMVRITMLALSQVPTESIESGLMSGCTPRQLLWRVKIPSAAPGLMVGVNQVIMLSLNMVIIASMIGAGGLGFDVLSSLKRLAIGSGLEAGVAITLLAIALDRLSQAFARRELDIQRERKEGWIRRHPHLTAAAAVVVTAWAISAYLPFVRIYPEGWTITTSGFWEELVKWINVNYFDQLEAFKTFLLLNILIPVKRFLLATPWVVTVAFVALLGYRLGGWRLALLTGSLALFIALTGGWKKGMVTVYLCGLSVVFAAMIGIPIGIWSARNERVHRVVQVCIDTLQTLPSFVYLIPVVMLFRVGDFAAMLAIVAYAVAPAIRYTDHGIRQVPVQLVEVAKSVGCTRGQILRKVQLPVALPEIMLGINQTIMMALSMLVITALVGTRELGQEVYIALTKADTGRGLVAGVSVAAIAIISDRLIKAWVARRRAALGLSDT